MSVFSAVSVELNKDILNYIGDNPVRFFEDIVRQSGVEIHVAEDRQFVKISGQWAAVNVAYQLIKGAVYGEQLVDATTETVGVAQDIIAEPRSELSEIQSGHNSSAPTAPVSSAASSAVSSSLPSSVSSAVSSAASSSAATSSAATSAATASATTSSAAPSSQSAATLLAIATRQKLDINVPEPLVFYPGLDPSDIDEAEYRGILEPGLLSGNVDKLPKTEFLEKLCEIGDVRENVSNIIGETDIIFVEKSSGKNLDENTFPGNPLIKPESKQTEITSTLHDVSVENLLPMLPIEESSVLSSELCAPEVETSASKFDSPEGEYVHKKLSTRRRNKHIPTNTKHSAEVLSMDDDVLTMKCEVTSPTNNDDSGYLTGRSRRARKPPKKFAEDDTMWVLAKSEKKRRKLPKDLNTKPTPETEQTKKPMKTVVHPETDIIPSDDIDVIEVTVKRGPGRPRKPYYDSDRKCPHCSFITTHVYQLKEHIRRKHTDNSNHSLCDICNKSFALMKDLKRHLKRHTRPLSRCDVCDKQYKDPKVLEEHKKRRHQEGYVPPERHFCSKCSKTFCNAYLLKNHVKTVHYGIKKMFICPTCGKTFSQKHSYMAHAKAHLGIKRFVCNVCFAQFTYDKSLKQHMYIHSSSRLFSCNTCSKTFRHKSAMIIHLKIHRDIKDFMCSVCSRGFTQKQALIRHERIHNGDKPFMCKLCGRAFGDTSIMRRHMLLVHKTEKTTWQQNTIVADTGCNKFFVNTKTILDRPYAGMFKPGTMPDGRPDVILVNDTKNAVQENHNPVVLTVLEAASHVDYPLESNTKQVDKVQHYGDVLQLQPANVKFVNSVESTSEITQTSHNPPNVDYQLSDEYPLTVLANQAAAGPNTGLSKFENLVHVASAIGKVSADSRPINTIHKSHNTDDRPTPSSSTAPQSNIPVVVTDINRTIRERLSAPPQAAITQRFTVSTVDQTPPPQPNQNVAAIFDDMQNIKTSDDSGNVTQLLLSNEDMIACNLREMPNDSIYIDLNQPEITIFDVSGQVGQSGQVIGYPYPTATFNTPQYVMLNEDNTIVGATDVIQNVAQTGVTGVTGQVQQVVFEGTGSDRVGEQYVQRQDLYGVTGTQSNQPTHTIYYQ